MKQSIVRDLILNLALFLERDQIFKFQAMEKIAHQNLE